MSDLRDPSLDTCGCCQAEPEPPAIYNRPGLPALAYRAGTYAAFFRRMLHQLGLYKLADGTFIGTRPLASLTTRAPDDPAIALLDAGAVMADVLTFYQERIANEGFLRTATERRSILEMARAIGYELNPGVAAGVYLAFTVEDAPGAPGAAKIPAGTRVLSIPPQGKLSQTFETSDAFTAHKEWNTLRPRRRRPQDLTAGIGQIYLNGTGNNLRIGDVILVTTNENSAAAHISGVFPDPDGKFTLLTLGASMAPLSGLPPAISATAPIDGKIPFNAETIGGNILGKTWSDSDLNAFLQDNGWDPQALVDYLSTRRAADSETTGYVYALRSRIGIFGNNAPLYASIPSTQRVGEEIYFDSSGGAHQSHIPPVYPDSWEDRGIDTDSQGHANTLADFFLEHTAPAVKAGGFFALESPDAEIRAYSIGQAVETSLSDYGMSAKVTGITADPTSDFSGFKVRRTTAYVQSEKLTPCETPISDDLPAGMDRIELDGFAFGLRAGQPVILSGTRADADGLLHNEALIIREISHNYGFSTIVLEKGLNYPYRRATVSLNANSVRATHGETVSEILGSGNGASANPQFILHKSPLTFTAAPTPGGSAGTLRLRVNNLLWDQAPSLYGLAPDDPGFIVRIDDDTRATVLFGDGQKGARLPTGENNVTAVYRNGIGLAGEVDAGSLTLLPAKPLGVRGVVNPLPAGGAGDPEKMENARASAPLTVRTLDRIVSRDDYEDFARTFAGVGKAQAVELWSGEHRLVHVTIAGADGQPVPAGDFRDNFLSAIDRARDPAQQVRVDTFDLLLFNLAANMAIDPRSISGNVFAAVREALIGAFSFDRRSFGQGVTAAEVITVIQEVKGIVYVDLDSLYLAGESPALHQIRSAGIAHMAGGALRQAQLLLINPPGIALREVSA